MKSTKLLTLFILGLGTMIMSSCKEDPYKTSHPDYGKIECLTVWDSEAGNFSLPEKYTLYVDGQTSTIPTTERVFPTLLKAGEYSVLVYSNSEKISVEPAFSTVAEVKVDKDGFINGNIGWLYAMSDIVRVKEDMVNKMTGEMKPLVRKLILILTIKDLAASYAYASFIDGSAVLTGVASQWDYIDNKVISGSEVKVRPEFKPGDNIGEFVASVDLLGIVPDSKEGQVLFFKLLYNDGGKEKTIDIKVDLTFSMKAFNTNKRTPMVLKCNIWDVEAEIIGWEVIDAGSQSVIWSLNFGD
ncbi:hypothetical protein EZS27_010592 [termite gut metagenome]|uniref:DUF5119 domain-containing protein n=1 Tax=termite gut metagenome TaxID=433724 RepID=A0A5J4S6Y5_9ZZZZ